MGNLNGSSVLDHGPWQPTRMVRLPSTLIVPPQEQVPSGPSCPPLPAVAWWLYLPLPRARSTVGPESEAQVVPRVALNEIPDALEVAAPTATSAPPTSSTKDDSPIAPA